MEQETMSPEWNEKQRKLNAECDDIIAHPENYEHYTSFKDLYAAILLNPECEKEGAPNQGDSKQDPQEKA